MGFLQRIFAKRPNIANLKAQGRVDAIAEVLKLNGEDWELRIAAVQALGDLARPEAIPSLESALAEMAEYDGILRELSGSSMAETPTYKAIRQNSPRMREALERSLRSCRRAARNSPCGHHSVDEGLSLGCVDCALAFNKAVAEARQEH